MSDNTKISWTDATYNPIYGCSKVSQGCKNCYAIDVVGSLPRKFKGTNPKAFAFYSGLVENGNWTGVVKLHEEHLTQPLRWQKPRRIFVNSLSDLFHESVAFKDIARIFAVMALASRHTFQVLTKRPARMLEFYTWLNSREGQDAWLKAVVSTPDGGKEQWAQTWPWKHIWLGVSVENQAAADERIPLLLRTPAAVRFLSCEPLLGPVDLSAWLKIGECPKCQGWGYPGEGDHPTQRCAQWCRSAKTTTDSDWCDLNLHQVIAGGESGPNFRAMDPRWAESLRDQCVAAKVAFFFKQHSHRKAGHQPWMLDSKGRCFRWHQFPGQLTEPELLWIP